MATKEELKKGSAAMNKILGGVGTQEEPGTTEKPKTKRNTRKQTKADTGQSEKPEKPIQKVFSFWADVETQKEWRTYAKAKEMTISDLGRNAIEEYINRHKLKPEEQQIYDLYLGKK